jgi:hypothetical protein
MLVRDIGVADGDRSQLEKSNGTADKKPLDRKTINNHLTLLIAQVNLAHELGWIAKVPKIRKPKIRLFEADYSYLRTKEEIRRLLAAAEAEGELVHALYATACSPECARASPETTSTSRSASSPCSGASRDRRRPVTSATSPSSTSYCPCCAGGACSARALDPTRAGVARDAACPATARGGVACSLAPGWR